jgi:anti-sigma factor RsiW
MIHQHLLQRADIGPPVVAYLASAHLDEDALSAFVEGRLSDTESAPLIQHLVACNSCRRFTAELVRLESEIGSGEVSAPVPPSTEPGRIRSLLEKLAARVLPESDEVFAYHAPADDFERKAEAKENEQSVANEQSEQKELTDRESE